MKSRRRDRGAVDAWVQPPDDLAEIIAAARVVDVPREPESVARAAQVHPDDAHAQVQEAGSRDAM